MDPSNSKTPICGYALSGYPKHIAFIRKKEKPIENLVDIISVHSALDYVDIYIDGQKKQVNNVTLEYMKNRLPPCLFFCCGQRDIVNMKRVERCSMVGRRIRLKIKGHDPVFVSRLRVKLFLSILVLYPQIKRGAGIQADVRTPKKGPDL